MQQHGPRITQLPVVSTETWHRVFCEWDSEEKGADFIANLYDRLLVENPEIAVSIGVLFQKCKDDDTFPLKAAMVYACSVYRMLELEAGQPLPVVSTETLAPIEEDIVRDTNRFYSKIVAEVERENPNVLESVLLLNVWYALAGDMKAAGLIPQAGLFIYKLLANQIEADNLAAQFG